MRRESLMKEAKCYSLLKKFFKLFQQKDQRFLRFNDQIKMIFAIIELDKNCHKIFISRETSAKAEKLIMNANSMVAYALCFVHPSQSLCKKIDVVFKVLNINDTNSMKNKVYLSNFIEPQSLQKPSCLDSSCYPEKNESTMCSMLFLYKKASPLFTAKKNVELLMSKLGFLINLTTNCYLRLKTQRYQVFTINKK